MAAVSSTQSRARSHVPSLRLDATGALTSSTSSSTNADSIASTITFGEITNSTSDALQAHEGIEVRIQHIDLENPSSLDVPYNTAEVLDDGANEAGVLDDGRGDNTTTTTTVDRDNQLDLLGTENEACVQHNGRNTISVSGDDNSVDVIGDGNDVDVLVETSESTWSTSETTATVLYAIRVNAVEVLNKR